DIMQGMAGNVAIAPWVIHDIRRSVATKMSQLRIEPHVVEAVLNHVSGFRAGVAGGSNKETKPAGKKKGPGRGGPALCRPRVRHGEQRRATGAGMTRSTAPILGPIATDMDDWPPPRRVSNAHQAQLEKLLDQELDAWWQSIYEEGPVDDATHARQEARSR